MSSSHKLVGRTLARCQALQLLFQAEACDRAVRDVLAGEYALSEGPLNEYGEQLAVGANEHIVDLDRVLSHAAQNWSLSRMSATDRNLLRIALYEMLYVDEVETAVCISECVELAKAFGSSDESSRFVNGVLGRIAASVAAGEDVVEHARRLDAEEATAFEDEGKLEPEPELADADDECDSYEDDGRGPISDAEAASGDAAAVEVAADEPESELVSELKPGFGAEAVLDLPLDGEAE